MEVWVAVRGWTFCLFLRVYSTGPRSAARLERRWGDTCTGRTPCSVTFTGTDGTEVQLEDKAIPTTSLGTEARSFSAAFSGHS